MPVRILALDHDTSSIEALQSEFDECEIVTASTGDAAVRLARGVDVVLVDLARRSQVGLETTARLRSDPTTGDLPVIVLVPPDSRDGIAKAFESGADDYLTKPLNRREVQARVKTHVERRRLRRSLDRLPGEPIVAELLGGLCPELSAHVDLIEGYAKLIGCSTAGANQPTVAKVLAATKRIAGLVEALNDCVQSHVPPRRTVDFHRIARTAVQVTQGALAQSGVWVSSTISSDPCWICGDSSAMVHAIIGFLLATSDILPRGGRLAVSSKALECGVALALKCSIESGGPTAPGGSLDPFDLAAANPGLTVARWVVESHGGRVHIDRSEDGPECTIRIVLPKSRSVN